MAWLQGLLTNDVEALTDGESHYAAYLTPQGRMITDMNVFARGDGMLLDVPASLAATLAREARRADFFGRRAGHRRERARCPCGP